VAGLAAAFGSGAMTNPIADIEKADVVLITGSNTTENHPVLSAYVKRAVKSGKTQLLVVDPKRIKIAQFANLYLQPNLGTDVVWINGLMHVIISESLYDKTFVSSRTEGFDELKQMVEKFTPEYVEKVTGIAQDDVVRAARLYASAKAASILYCMGITQHISGTDNVKSLANLAMLCGNMGIEGGGVNPLRGQNNVQGACDLGGLPNVFTAYQPVTNKAIRKKLEFTWRVPKLPDTPGLTVTQMLPKAHSKELKALYIIGENPMVSDPDLNHAEASLSHLDFLVVQDIFMTETAKLADVVLPSTCYAEKDGTFTNTERKVQRIRKAIDPPGQARNDWWITSQIASRMGFEMTYENSEAIFEEIRTVTPSYAGISYERIQFDGLHWPCPSPEHPGTPMLHVGKFPRGKGLFHAIDYIPPDEQIDEQYPVYLTTGRLLYHYHTGTMTMKSDDINTCAPECFVEISPQSANQYGITDGQMIKVASRRGEITAKARLSSALKQDVVFIPFHFGKAAANKLTNSALDPVSKIPEFKVCAVRLEAA
jgi:formate dehydrogenase alpha subunit